MSFKDNIALDLVAALFHGAFCAIALKGIIGNISVKLF